MRTEIHIQIHTYDNKLKNDIFGESINKGREEIFINGGVKLKLDGIHYGWDGFGSADYVPPDTLFLVLSIPINVAGSLIANWLYDKLKNKKVEKLVIERTEVLITEGEIKSIIEEKLKLEKK